MTTLVLGLLGAALGIGLYRLGWYSARRTPAKNASARAMTPMSVLPPMSERELQNFLQYDGSEQKGEE